MNRLINLAFNNVYLTKSIPQIKKVVCPVVPIQIVQERCFRRHHGHFLVIMKKRRKLIGPDRLRKRNEWENWNYKSEIYSFCKRLNDEITENTLSCAFVHDSYLISEKEKREALDMPLHDVTLDLKSNTPLINQGSEIISNYLDFYLKCSFPHLPIEGIKALHDHLLSDDVMGYVSSNLGTKDLIFCAEYPPSQSTYAATLKAIIGGIAKDESASRAEQFVLDFICPQLIGKDVFDIWDLQNPLKILNDILIKHGFPECEPRLIFESGRNTIEAVYHVGLYCNKGFLGRGPGETLDIAVEMAAYDCLRKLFGINEHEKPISYGIQALDLDLKSVKPHLYLKEWYSNDFNSVLRIQQ